MTYDGEYKFTYDGWNRLVTVTRAYLDSSSALHFGSKIATMTYDGAGRRIVKAITHSGDWDSTYHYYYKGQSMAETRNGSGYVLKQHVWGLTYIDELVQVACSVSLTTNKCPQRASNGYGPFRRTAHRYL